MQSCIFSPQSARCLDGLHDLILHFPAWPFSELFGQTDPPPINSTQILECMDFQPGNLFLQGTWYYTLYICLPWCLSRVHSRKSLEGSAQYLRVIFLLHILTVLEGYPKWSEKLDVLPATIEGPCLFLSVSAILGGV